MTCHGRARKRGCDDIVEGICTIPRLQYALSDSAAFSVFSDASKLILQGYAGRQILGQLIPKQLPHVLQLTSVLPALLQ